VSVEAQVDLKAFAEAAVARARQLGPVENMRGVDYYDTRKDEVFTSLDEFRAASDFIVTFPLVSERYGENEVPRLVLQFAYETIRRVSEAPSVADAIASVWDDFSGELQKTTWTWRGVANLTNFVAEQDPIDLGAGVSVRGRSFEELAELGFSEATLDQLADDWSGFGASSFVILVEHQELKKPENLIMGSTGDLWTKARRAIEAMRLVALGDVGFGPMWTTREARFNVGIGGTSRTGWAIPNLGSSYTLKPHLVDAVRAAEGELEQLDAVDRKTLPVNVSLAVASYMATFDRWPRSTVGAVVDSFTALEALLAPGGTEITFRLAFRVASLLAEDNATRVALFNDIKAWYGIRSRLVHGDVLSGPQRERLAGAEDLREIVRRLVTGFIHLTLSEPDRYSKKFFKEELDAALIDDTTRDELRQTLRLAHSTIDS
jgi:hypothetical protein